jgi:hypothetical protein
MSAPYVNIELDEKRKLRYRHNEMADIEVLTGKDVGHLLIGQKFHGIRVVLAFGLRWNMPKITPTQAGDLIQDHWIAKGKTLEELVDVIESALVAGGVMKSKTPKPEDDEGNDQPETAA